jgi:dienelactone hydrolase
LRRISQYILVVGLLVLSACSSDSGSGGGGQQGGILKPAGAGGCSVMNASTGSFNYCVLDPSDKLKKSDKAVSIVYYWHGVNGSPSEIFNNPLIAQFAQYTTQIPVVISISKGPQGVIGNDAGAVVDEVIPTIEKAEGVSNREVARQLVGASMGGHNVLRIAAEDPFKFVAATALCPALVNMNPHNSSELVSYMQRHGSYLDQNFFQSVMAVFRSAFPTSADWIRNNPIEFLKKNAYGRLPVHLSIGTEDSLGFNEGVEAFESIYRTNALRVKLETSYVSGGHCAFDTKKASQFISQWILY